MLNQGYRPPNQPPVSNQNNGVWYGPTGYSAGYAPTPPAAAAKPSRTDAKPDRKRKTSGGGAGGAPTRSGSLRTPRRCATARLT